MEGRECGGGRGDEEEGEDEMIREEGGGELCGRKAFLHVLIKGSYPEPLTSPPLTSHIPGGQTAEEKEILELTQRLINAVIERDFSEYS